MEDTGEDPLFEAAVRLIGALDEEGQEIWRQHTFKAIREWEAKLVELGAEVSPADEPVSWQEAQRVINALFYQWVARMEEKKAHGT